MLTLTLFILAMGLRASNAAVIRSTDTQTDSLETSTAADILTTSTPSTDDLTTIRDLDLLITTSKDVLSEDDKATILVVDQTLIDSSPAELTGAEAQTIEFEKFGKLLLLSTPKIAEKPKEPEENLDESEEENNVVENVTQIDKMTTTIDTTNDDPTTILNTDDEELTTQFNLEMENRTDADKIPKSKNIIKSNEIRLKEASAMNLLTTENITKLYPVNDTLYADNNKDIGNGIKECSAAFVEAQSEELSIKNPVSVALEKYEVDYVVMESEALQGSFTDVESELHLQPIVQSLEIVPSSLDDTLLINYVSSW